MTPQIDDEPDETDEEADPNSLVDQVIASLGVATEPVNVAHDHPNNLDSSVEAFAKLAGREWTYYIRSLEIMIGRPPDPSSRTSVGGDLNRVRDDAAAAEIVQIDLGPSKVISRGHAELYFDQEQSVWCIRVLGRNGIYVEDHQWKKGYRVELKSGNVIEIGGTQMMFVTAEGAPHIDPKWIERLRATADGTVLPPANHAQMPLRHAHAHPAPSGRDDRSYSSQTQAATTPQMNGHPPLAPATSNPQSVQTPKRSPTKLEHSMSGQKQSPSYGRGIMVENGQEIDYADEANSHIKPSCSYAVMISRAILEAPEQRLTLSGIYEWIAHNFAFYRLSQNNWRVSRSGGAFCIRSGL